MVTSVYTALNNGIVFIALNDDPDVMSLKAISETLSVVTLSAAFGLSAKTIAKSVLTLRRNTR